MNSKLHAVCDGQGRPLVLLLSEGQMSDHKGARLVLDALPPARELIADRGYDSNTARALLVSREIEPIIPKRRNNKKATHQDGRKLRRYKRRWIIERTNSWLQNFRRLVARYERKVKNFEALVHLACALVTLKKV